MNEAWKMSTHEKLEWERERQRAKELEKQIKAQRGIVDEPKPKAAKKPKKEPTRLQSFLNNLQELFNKPRSSDPVARAMFALCTRLNGSNEQKMGDNGNELMRLLYNDPETSEACHRLKNIEWGIHYILTTEKKIDSQQLDKIGYLLKDLNKYIEDDMTTLIRSQLFRIPKFKNFLFSPNGHVPPFTSILRTIRTAAKKEYFKNLYDECVSLSNDSDPLSPKFVRGQMVENIRFERKLDRIIKESIRRTLGII